jgi:hypothetical protein
METSERTVTPAPAADQPLEPGPARERITPASLRDIALAALAATALVESGGSSELAELRFLRERLERHGRLPGGWATALRHHARAPADQDLPLLALAAVLGLNRVEVLAVALAAAVEDDMLVGRAIARLQAPVGGSRPMVGLLATAFADAAPRDVRAIDALLTGAAVRSGLLALPADGAPMPERYVRVPSHICHALAGRDDTAAGATIGLEPGGGVLLPPSILREVERHARGLAGAPGQTLVVRSGSRAEGRAAAAAVAHAMGRRPLFIEGEPPAALAPWLVLRNLVPVHCLELAPGERKVLPALSHGVAPAIVVCGPDGGVESVAGSTVSWSVPVPPREERAVLWATALGPAIDPSVAPRLAREYRHASGRIAQLGRLIRRTMANTGRGEPSLADLAAAAWAGEGSGLDALAQPLPAPIPDDALVMTPSLRRELETLLLRCRARDELVTGLGASAVTRYHPGVRALFVGASGTGKTLAAGWLATRLALPLYRVDLASITSKYIGDTEKNLAQLLARAEQAEVVLLFDEADALFGKRTDVKDSNDRFANAQTNYLLQRIESYDGITLLTSNSRSRFDSAFSRRLDVVIEFPLPGPEERRALWLSHLGTTHRLTLREVNQLAARVDFAGGHVRNVVLMAAVLAQTAGRPIEYADVLYGLAGEYLKLGRQMPIELGARAPA